jgi:4-oxalocrotonate tautomerase
VNIRVTEEGATAEEKAEVIKEVTEFLVDVPGKKPAATCTVIDEVNTENWGTGSVPVTERRRHGQ